MLHVKKVISQTKPDDFFFGVIGAALGAFFGTAFASVVIYFLLAHTNLFK
jgi:hypothetical protein